MAGGVEQRALVMLAVNLHQGGAERAQRLHATGWSLTKARVRPSANCTRRMINSPSISTPCSRACARAGRSEGTSKTAVTWPCAWLCRTSAPSPRAPSASARASRRIDLPAPVSPVRMERPAPNSRSSRSISTISRIVSRTSMGDAFRSARHDRVVDFRNPRVFVLFRLEPAAFQERVGVLVPLAVRKIVAENGGRGLRLVGDAEAEIGFGQAIERLFGVTRRLIAGENIAEAIDRGDVIATMQVETADRYLFAGELIAGDLNFIFRIVYIFGIRIFLNDRRKEFERLGGALLVAGNVRDLRIVRARLEISGVGGVGRIGIELDVFFRRLLGVVVFAGLELRIGRHQQGLLRPI